ncbi:MAG: AAC(3) family N-acetyltransferase [Victivallales bacterium]|nr:AAC(3) family N-acetyltransferase [Victivallales bacterium]
MEPEKGDKSIHVCVDDVCKAYLEVGVQPGDTLFMHGSLSSMGTVDGGPTTVFDGMLKAVGSSGTVGMPSLWFYQAGMYEKDFDVNSSPTYVGALGEAMRLDPRSKRSNHFSHAAAAIGARAEELTRNHGAYGPRPSPWSEKAFAEASPWTRLYEWNALYTFIGVTMRVCTMKHWIEGAIILHYLETVPVERRQEARDYHLRKDCSDGVWPFYNSQDLQQELEKLGLVRKSKIGSATLTAIRVRPLVENTMKLMLSDPERWLNAEFRQWVDDLRIFR